MRIGTFLGVAVLLIGIKIFLDNREKPKNPNLTQIPITNASSSSSTPAQNQQLTSSKPPMSTRNSIQNSTTSRSGYTGY